MALLVAPQHDIPGLEAFDQKTQRAIQREVRRKLKTKGRGLAKHLVRSEIAAICAEPSTVTDIAKRMGRRHTGYLIKHYLAPMMSEGLLVESGGLYSTPRTP